MAEYTITLGCLGTQTITVEADSLDEAIDNARDLEGFFPVIGQSFEFPDEVEAVVAYLPDGRELDLEKGETE